MRILLVGDVNGRPGRRLLRTLLPSLVPETRADLVVANVENAADGFGVTPELADQIRACGVHCMTSGNHIWDKPEIAPYLDARPDLLRPANYPESAPGRGIWIGEAGGAAVAVVNLMGRVYMPPCDDPFRAADRALEIIGSRARVIVVDMHGEATSEKQAIAAYLDGRVSA